MLVLLDIIFGDRRYFRELLTGSLEGIASNILADRLKRLVAADILRDDAARRPAPPSERPQAAYSAAKLDGGTVG